MGRLLYSVIPTFVNDDPMPFGSQRHSCGKPAACFNWEPSWTRPRPCERGPLKRGDRFGCQNIKLLDIYIYIYTYMAYIYIWYKLQCVIICNTMHVLSIYYLYTLDQRHCRSPLLYLLSLRDDSSYDLPCAHPEVARYGPVLRQTKPDRMPPKKKEKNMSLHVESRKHMETSHSIHFAVSQELRRA